MPHKGGARHADAQHRQDIEPVNFQVSTEARHFRSAKAVDTGLNQHVGKRDDHALNASRKSHFQNSNCHVFLDAKPTQGNPIVRFSTHKERHCQHTGNQLAGIRGDSCALNAHMKPLNQQNVQRNVDNRRNAQIEQRTAGVPCRIENTRRHVINHTANQTAGVHLKIPHRIFQHIRRRLHPDQKLAAQENTRHRQHQPQNAGDGQRRVHRCTQATLILCADVLGHHHAGTHGSPLAKGDQQVDQCCAGAHRRQRIAAHIVSHNNGIHGTVHLLEQIAQNERNGKYHDLFPDCPLRHQVGAFGSSAGVHCFLLHMLSLVSLSSETAALRRTAVNRFASIFSNTFIIADISGNVKFCAAHFLFKSNS